MAVDVASVFFFLPALVLSFNFIMYDMQYSNVFMWSILSVSFYEILYYFLIQKILPQSKIGYKVPTLLTQDGAPFIL